MFVVDELNGCSSFTFRAKKIGDTLFASNISPTHFKITLNVEQKQQAINNILTTRPSSISINTDQGPVVLDADLTEQLSTALLVDMVNTELGDLLTKFPPSE